jgi:hypothetical protein
VFHSRQIVLETTKEYLSMNLIQRVQDILLKPKQTWPAIAEEPIDVATIYTTYLIFLQPYR